MFKTIILSCSDQLKDERTDQAIYHILQGRKSIQTVQDIYLYNLEIYYQVLPRLNQDFFKEMIKELVDEQFMMPSTVYEDSYTITSKGKNVIQKTSFPSIVSYLNGKKYGAYTKKFEQRLFLFFQVLSNMQARNNTYVPIIDDYDVKNDIKKLFQQLQHNSMSLANQFFEEITTILKTIDDPYAHLFVNRLSGYGHYGKSIQQIANDIHMMEIDAHILYQSIIHYILQQIDVSEEQFPVLSLVNMKKENSHVTISASHTKKMLDRGMTLEQVAVSRQLKMNTIFDHIVEIALEDESFNIHPFIDEKEIAMILQTARELDTYQLKELKDTLGDDYSYFQIRLALARGGALNE